MFHRVLKFFGLSKTSQTDQQAAPTLGHSAPYASYPPPFAFSYPPGVGYPTGQFAVGQTGQLYFNAQGKYFLCILDYIG
jgi:hypothetical protein